LVSLKSCLLAFFPAFIMSRNKIEDGVEDLTFVTPTPTERTTDFSSSPHGSTMSVKAFFVKKEKAMGSSRSIQSSSSQRKLLTECCADDPRTVRGRRTQLAKVLGMAAIPIVVLVIQASIAMRAAIMQQMYASSFKDHINFAVQAGNLVHALQLERGTTTFYVSVREEDLLKTALAR
jgi:hypothetical protein